MLTIQRIFSLPVQIFTKEAVVLVFFRTCHDVVVAIAANHGQRFNSTGQETTIMNILVYCIMHRWRVIRHPALLLRLRGVYTLRFARVDAHPARIVASSIETDLWKLNTFDPSPHNFSSILFPKSFFVRKRWSIRLDSFCSWYSTHISFNLRIRECKYLKRKVGFRNLYRIYNYFLQKNSELRVKIRVTFCQISSISS